MTDFRSPKPSNLLLFRTVNDCEDASQKLEEYRATPKPTHQASLLRLDGILGTLHSLQRANSLELFEPEDELAYARMMATWDELNEAEAAYEKALAEARAQAQKIAGETKAEIQKDLDAAIAKADAEIAARSAESEARIAEIRDGALAAVDQVAKDTAGEIVAALGGNSDASAVNAAVEQRLKG